MSNLALVYIGDLGGSKMPLNKQSVLEVPRSASSRTLFLKHHLPFQGSVLVFFCSGPKKGHKSGTKKEPKPKLLGPDIFRWGGGLPREREGWGPKSSVCPSKPREPNFFGGISRDFAGISRKRPKSLRKKCLGSIFGP